MTTSAEARSGKTHRDENFPVASQLIAPRHRGIILAFYRFVRTADDVADHPRLSETEKLALLDQLEEGLLGKNAAEPDAIILREALIQRDLPPRHALDLLTAFRMDVVKRRYRDWDDLIGYCSYSAMPVGRFVLDVHGESRSTWPANDALCAALQIINHLQDCGRDYRDLDRVYVPLDALAAGNATVEDLGRSRASPAMRGVLKSLAERTCGLLRNSVTFGLEVRDLRLSMEIAAIQRLAERLAGILIHRDPLSERVHLTQAGFLCVGILGVARGFGMRLARGISRLRDQAQDA
jgi:hydroxysqualene synthase